MDADMTVFVEFEPIGRRGDCPSGASLLECARLLGVDLVSICGGNLSCGRCVVQIMEGPVSPVSPAEGKFLSEQQLAEGYRLACSAVPLGKCRVRVPPESLTAPQRTQVEGLEIPVAPDPPVRAYTVVLPPPTLRDLRGEVERLRDALARRHGIDVGAFDLAALQRLPVRRSAQPRQIAVAVRGEEAVAMLRPDVRPLGLAVDLGTTKIALYLVDLGSGRTVAARGLMNPQIAYGEDVVARLGYALQDRAHADRLQEVVVEALNEAIGEMCDEVGQAPEEVVEAVVVGNTAMHHLFLALPVAQLARAPYVPAVQSALDVKARDIGLRLAPGAYVHLLPNIAGFVGADHVAMLLATGVAEAEGVTLALDIGTNTEICLVCNGELTSLSCASGPAFEGAHIRHGMRAARGAIERVRVAGDRVEIQTIEGAPPVGICGSGILDALAQLRLAGVVDANGRIREHPRVREGDGGREFVLVDEGEGGDGRPAITLTQRDVRELQLAKGAIRAGIDVLLRTRDIGEEEIDRVVVAGAFGTYIDIGSAVTIGMLPRLPLERFRQVGNAAGSGARAALVSLTKRAEAQEIARRVDYVELAAYPDFAQIFARAMRLG